MENDNKNNGESFDSEDNQESPSENIRNLLPRPKQSSDIYLNSDEKIIYRTDNNEFPIPHSNCYYIVHETKNSSPRLVRSTFNKIFCNPKTNQETSLPLGFSFQPFNSFSPNEEPVELVELTDSDVLRCRRCKSFVNLNFDFRKDSNGGNKNVFWCNLCDYENELTNIEGLKNEYINSSNINCKELNKPTIDFLAPMKYHEREIHNRIIYLIDITDFSMKIGFGTYIINCILKILLNLKERNGIFVSIILINEEKLYFFEYRNELNVIIVESDDPFVPVYPDFLFINIESDPFELIIEKILSIIESENKTKKQPKSKYVQFPRSLITCINILEEKGGRLFTFFCSNFEIPPNSKNQVINKDDYEAWLTMLYYKTDSEKKLYQPLTDFFTVLIEKCNKKMISVYSFFFSNYLIDVSSVYPLCGETGGRLHLYQMDIDHNGLNNSSSKDFKIHCEKLYYDLMKIMGSPLIKQVGFKIRLSPELEFVEFLGPFGTKKNSSFEIAGCSDEYNFSAIVKIREELKNNQNVYIQFASIFTNQYNQRIIRIINYSIQASNDTDLIYKSIDICCLTKITILKTILVMIEKDLENSREYLKQILIKGLFVYRKKASRNSSKDSIVLAEGLRMFPLYLNGYLKKQIAIKTKSDTNISEINYQIHKFFSEPIFLTIKFIHPRFYRLDNIKSLMEYPFEKSGENTVSPLHRSYITGIGTQFMSGLDDIRIIKPLLTPLSFDYIDTDMVFVLDDGVFLFIIVYNKVDPEFLNLAFNLETFQELIDKDPDYIETNDSELNKRLHNAFNQIREDNHGYTQPFTLVCLKSEDSRRDYFKQFLIEDYYNREKSYLDFLFEIHDEVVKLMDQRKYNYLEKS